MEFVEVEKNEEDSLLFFKTKTGQTDKNGREQKK
jgi:hypothetical protein